MIPPKKKSESRQAKERRALTEKNKAAGIVTAEQQNRENWRSYHSFSRQKAVPEYVDRETPTACILQPREWRTSREDQAEVDRILGKSPRKIKNTVA